MKNKMLNIDYDGTLDLQRYQNWKKKNHELARIANIPRTAPDAVWTGDGTVGGGTDPGQQPASQSLWLAGSARKPKGVWNR